jgi:hypothetical protein
MNTKDLLEEAGFSGNERAEFAAPLAKYSELIIRRLMKVVAAHALTNETALDVFTNLNRLYPDE